MEGQDRLLREGRRRKNSCGEVRSSSRHPSAARDLGVSRNRDSSPAARNDTRSLSNMNIEETLWHPVAALDELGAALLAVRLLERDVLLWRDGANDVHAWADRCPHRGTRLSLGRIV